MVINHLLNGMILQVGFTAHLSLAQISWLMPAEKSQPPYPVVLFRCDTTHILGHV